MTKLERKATFKLDEIKSIEALIQNRWNEEKLFEVDAPDDYSDGQSKSKFMVTFPFPYANGFLHVGHAFTITKAEFAVGYNRLKGKRSLWPFGIHCSGMPIKANADKLKREIDTYGCPPNFESAKSNQSANLKSKVAAKTGNMTFIWDIVKSFGVPESEIPLFSDSTHWLKYFPAFMIEHLKNLGCKVDWRRSFITTDLNAYFNSFVQWQFCTLYDKKLVEFGKRLTIFSPKDGQPCMDHDRTTGEGVGPQEYTILKLKLCKPYPEPLKSLESSPKDVYLAAATLRPETIYGITNCWIGPEIEYICFETAKHGYLISTHRAASNMSYQEIISEKQCHFDVISTFNGHHLLGCKLIAPMSKFDCIYALPMMTIKKTKGTGVVMSVPSDSPDDYIALLDLKKKPALREKFSIDAEKVEPFDPVYIIEGTNPGVMAAEEAVNFYKIQSQNDTEKLLKAKEDVYREGFYKGKMAVGAYIGKPVKDAKSLITADLINSGSAFLYYEPENLVISRSEEECVVALCDQWYLNYGNSEWKSKTQLVLDRLNVYSSEVMNNFLITLAGMHEHACSRSYGLGTYIPWDENYLIDSLSDSTIYMAFYTIVHLLQDSKSSLMGDVVGSSKIRPEQMTRAVWDYIYLGSEFIESQMGGLTKAQCDKLRQEFMYWYPMDLRVSGKDLIPNHLTYMLYNHQAIWPDSERNWPLGVRANGFMLLNGDKMSKSTGNFLTLKEAIEKFSADGTRLALADAGDLVEDGNFEEKMADAAFLRLYTYLEWVREFMRTNKLNIQSFDYKFSDNQSDLRHCDRIFLNEMNCIVYECDRAYSRLMFKDALRLSFFQMQNARDNYREYSLGMQRPDLLLRFIYLQCIILAPICPHICDYIWRDVLRLPGTVINANWPDVPAEDRKLTNEYRYLDSIGHRFRILKQKMILKESRNKQSTTVNYNRALIHVARNYPDWQKCIIEVLTKHHKMEIVPDSDVPKIVFPDNKVLLNEFNSNPEYVERTKPFMKNIMPVVNSFKKLAEESNSIGCLDLQRVDEWKVISLNENYLASTLGLVGLSLLDSSLDQKTANSVSPFEPLIEFKYEPCVNLKFINRQCGSKLFSLDFPVQNGDSLEQIIKRLISNLGVFGYIDNGSEIILYKFVDSIHGPRKIPNMHALFDGLEKLSVDENLSLISIENMTAFYRNSQLGSTLIYHIN